MGGVRIRSRYPTCAEVAEALRANGMLFDVTTAEVREAAKARGVVLREGRMSHVAGNAVGDIYFHLMRARGVDTLAGMP